jgi:single-strand DNA-binding protein
MASFNRVLLLGNLTRDPQLKYLPSQTPVAEFGLACNRKFKTAQGEDREEVLFVDCSAFGRQAEVINQYCQKGRPLFVEGRLKLDTWEDKNGGGKRSKLTVVVENFQLLGSRDGGQGGGGGGGGGGGYDSQVAANDEYASRPAPAARGPQSGAGRPAPAARAPQQAPAEKPFGEESQIDENDIPF